MRKIEFQTMPLRFRVWDNNDRQFYTLDDLMPGISEPVRSCTRFTLDDLFALQKQFSKVLLTSTRFAISQDTGLKDKNRKSIFTGDLVSAGGVIAIATYIHGHIGYEVPFEGYLMVNPHQLEIVGNIWQNPKLLKGYGTGYEPGRPQ